MKKLVTLWTMVAALCFSTLPATAEDVVSVWEISATKTPVSGITNGMNVVFESASNVNALGYYLPAFTSTTASYYLAGVSAIDANSVWTIEATGTTNEYLSDAPQYVLKNQGTGTYLSMYEADDDTWWQMVASADEAVKLSFFEPSDATHGMENNTNDSWDANSVCIQFTCVNGESIDTLCLNSYWGNGYYIWPYRDTHVWNMYQATESTSQLAILNYVLNSYGDLSQYYTVGTNPGQINSEHQEIYDNFYAAYQEALDAVESQDKTEEEYATIRTTLAAAKEAIDDSTLLNEITDGYYYFVTADANFSENKAITNVAGSTNLTWNTFDENDLAYVWEVHKTANGYSVQNVSTSVYFDKAASTASSQAVYVADAYTTPSEFILLNCSGVYHISDSIDYADGIKRPYHMGGHGSGSGTSGNILLWRDDAYTASSWYVRPVSDEMAEQIENNKGITKLETQLSSAKTSLRGMLSNIGTLVGQWPQSAATELQAAVDEADALIASTGTNDEYLAMAEKMKSTIAAVAASRNKAEDGKYYRFVNAYPEFLNQQGHEKAIASMRDAYQWMKLDSASLSFIFQATANEDGSYYFQNVSTKKYMGQATSTSNSVTISQSTDPVAINLVNFNDSVYDFKIMPRDMARMYHPAGHSAGAGRYGSLVNWDSGSHEQSAWYVREVPTDSVQLMLFDRLIKKAEDKTDAAYVYEPDLTNPVATTASQYYSNNQEPNEGSYAALCDGNTDDLILSNGQFPNFHSAYSNPDDLVDDYHYLRIDAGEGKTIPEKFILTFTNRTTQGDRIRPRIIKISVSNDDENYTDLVTLSHNVAKYEPENDYVSPEINAGGSYRYVKMTVLATTGYDPEGEGTGQYDKYWHQFFALTEMNVYPSNGLSVAAQINDTNVKDAVDVLNAAITEAKTTYNTGSVTDADFEKLQAAIDAFGLVWKDTSLYTAKVAEVNILKENLIAGDEVGNVTADALSTFESEIATPSSISPVYKLTKAEMDAAIAELDAALAKVKASMVMPDSKKWYFITSADANADNSTTGFFVMQYGRTEGTNMYDNTLEDPSEHINNVWIFENDGAGKFYIRNVGSGMYQKASEPEEGGNVVNAGVTGALPEAESFSLIPLGSGQFAFKSNSGNYYIHCSSAGYAVTWETPDEGVTDLTDTKFAYEFSEAEGVTSEIPRPFNGVRLGSLSILTFPTAVALAPQATIGEDEDNTVTFELYNITGKVENEEGAITALKLSKITAEEPAVEAGKPFILYAPGDYSENVTTNAFEVVFYVDGEVAQAEDDSINGLIGLFEPRTFADDATKAYFSGDSIASVTTEVTFANQRGYIDVSQIAEVADATNDLIVYVKGAGISGIINNISNAVVEDGHSLVDVYTTDGVLVRKNVELGKATNGLAKGVYIVGKNKVLVK